MDVNFCKKLKAFRLFFKKDFKKKSFSAFVSRPLGKKKTHSSGLFGEEIEMNVFLWSKPTQRLN